MTTAVVPAAGSGARLRESLKDRSVPSDDLLSALKTDPNLPKVLLPLCGRPVLWWTLKGLCSTPQIRTVVVGAAPGYEEMTQRVIGESGFARSIRIVSGGSRRQETVFRCLLSLPEDTMWVVIHDGARPLIRPSVVSQVWRAAQATGAATAAIPCTDTVKESWDGVLVNRTVDRRLLWAAQTPQVFSRYLIERAHRLALEKGWAGTDDASLVEQIGLPVRLVRSDPFNIKLTSAADFLFASSLIGRKERSALSQKE